MDNDIVKIVNDLRRFGAEATRVEAKTAQGGIPASARETLSAFCNTPGGGILILGLEESRGFRALGIKDPAKIQADLASMARDSMSPPLQPTIGLAEVEGQTVVYAVIHELPREQKPCYVSTLGLQKGTFIRIGESDRRLTSEEVSQIIAERGQPIFDNEVVQDASINDLDADAIEQYVRRLRASNPRLWAQESDQTIMLMTRVLIKDPAGTLKPSLAAYLSLARYPQRLYPQLNVTFVHYPTVDGGSTPSGVRFLDNVRIDGSIPAMTQEALAAIQRNMSRRSLIVDHGRRDFWEYPPEALREAIVNALVHRDLSHGSRGNQVQIEMYPDRLRIHNPGGLFGSIDINHLGEEGRSSARNSLLMKLLEDIVVPGEDRTVCENRGSGIRTMIAALRQAGMSPPAFKDRITSFEVTMPNHALLDDDTIAWLNHLGREGLRDSQCVALALMRRGEVLDNARYRAVTGVNDSRVATFELQDLVARELVDQSGSRGSVRYTISSSARQSLFHRGRLPRPNRRLQIMRALEMSNELPKSEVASLIGVSEKTAEHWLRIMKKDGSIEVASGGGTNRNTTYRLTINGVKELLPLFGDEPDDMEN